MIHPSIRDRALQILMNLAIIFRLYIKHRVYEMTSVFAGLVRRG